MVCYELSHVKHASTHCLAPGLFRSLQKGQRKKEKLDITYALSDGGGIRFVGFEPLGTDDLLFLQGLVALAGLRGKDLPQVPNTEMGVLLRNAICKDSAASLGTLRVVNEKMSTLLKEIDMTDGGENIRALKASLLRMQNVTIQTTDSLLKKKSMTTVSQLIGYNFDNHNEMMYVTLNPYLTNSIIGIGSFTRIEMSEIRGIKTGPTRLIHQRLCAWINQGEKRQVGMETLCGYISFDDGLNISRDTMRKREFVVKRALTELKDLGWTISLYAKNKYEITRPNSN